MSCCIYRAQGASELYLCEPHEFELGQVQNCSPGSVQLPVTIQAGR